jgi:hypothetical protein
LKKDTLSLALKACFKQRLPGKPGTARQYDELSIL